MLYDIGRSIPSSPSGLKVKISRRGIKIPLFVYTITIGYGIYRSDPKVEGKVCPYMGIKT